LSNNGGFSTEISLQDLIKGERINVRSNKKMENDQGIGVGAEKMLFSSESTLAVIVSV